MPLSPTLRRIPTRSLLLVAGVVIAFLFALHIPAKSATSIAPGDLIKGPTDAVYYYGQNGKRFVFPNAKTYFTWYTDFSTVKIITAEELASIPLRGNVTYRPGVKLVKVTTDPKVYAVGANAVLRWVKTENVAKVLHGADWNKKVEDIPDAFFVNYTVGTDIGSASDFSPSGEMIAAKNINLDKKLGTLIWFPKPSATFQWQLSGVFDNTVNADVYDLDLFDTPKETIGALHAKGKKVICYISAGSWENWRPDKDAFPSIIIGKDYGSWPGEKWLDIRRIDGLGPILQKRFDLAKEKGCDAIEPDNIDGFRANTGFPLTYADQLRFNQWLADQAHQRDMSIGLKNDSEQVRDLLPYFDWALTEGCHVQGWCEQMAPLVSAGKAVFQIEYTDSHTTLAAICPAAKKLGFSASLKHRNLDAWIQRCP